jgi:sulfur dioxygenase
VIFRQLFDPETSTYSYLLADSDTREGVLVDPVLEQVDRDVALVRELEIALRFTLETHVHADHVTGSGRLRETLGSKVGVGAESGVRNADRLLRDGDVVRFGRHALDVCATPGHTRGCVSYVERAVGVAFTGDALLVRGCGRTDFQDGDARTLFRSVRERLFVLPDEVLLYPGHDYKGRTVTSVAEEKRWNPRLGLAVTEGAFVGIMAGLRLAHPKRIDVAVPANLMSGVAAVPAPDAPGPVAALTEELGRQDADAWWGHGI